MWTATYPKSRGATGILGHSPVLSSPKVRPQDIKKLAAGPMSLKQPDMAALGSHNHACSLHLSKFHKAELAGEVAPCGSAPFYAGHTQSYSFGTTGSVKCILRALPKYFISHSQLLESGGCGQPHLQRGKLRHAGKGFCSICHSWERQGWDWNPSSGSLAGANLFLLPLVSPQVPSPAVCT